MQDYLQMSLFNVNYPYQEYLLLDRLARIFQWQEIEPDLMGLSRRIFLNSSDSYDCSSLRVSSLKMLPESCTVTEQKTLPLSYTSSLRWGMWGHGKQETEHTGHHKIGTEFTVLVITGDVQRQHISPDRRSLIDCLENGFAVIDRHQTGDRIYSTIAPTLRSQGNGGGSFKVKTAHGTRPLLAVEYERLMGWSVGSTEFGIMNGSEVVVSRCQRTKILGNGMIPAEITDICLNLKEFFDERSKQHLQ